MPNRHSQYEVIEGQISNLIINPANVHFLKTIKREQQIAGAVAVGQAMAEQAGAVFSAQAAMDEGDPVESFSMIVAGEPVTGSFWKTTFQEGDEIKVIGSRISGCFRAIATVAPKTRIIWMQPHCERGTHSKRRHLIKNSIFFAIFGIVAALLLTAFTNTALWANMLVMSISIPVILIVTVGMSWPDFMASSQEMNAVATALGWSNPAETDLFKSTRAARARKLAPRQSKMRHWAKPW